MTKGEIIINPTREGVLRIKRGYKDKDTDANAGCDQIQIQIQDQVQGVGTKRPLKR